MDTAAKGYEYMVHDRSQWRAFDNTAMNFQISVEDEELFFHISDLWILKKDFTQWNKIATSEAASMLTIGWSTEQIFVSPTGNSVAVSWSRIINRFN
jgi:hypothetical protein